MGLQNQQTIYFSSISSNFYKLIKFQENQYSTIPYKLNWIRIPGDGELIFLGIPITQVNGKMSTEPGEKVVELHVTGSKNYLQHNFNEII